MQNSTSDLIQVWLFEPVLSTSDLTIWHLDVSAMTSADFTVLAHKHDSNLHISVMMTGLGLRHQCRLKLRSHHFYYIVIFYFSLNCFFSFSLWLSFLFIFYFLIQPGCRMGV